MDYALNNKRRVIRLVLQWAATYGDLLQEDDVAVAFLEVCVAGGGVGGSRGSFLLRTHLILPIGTAGSLGRLCRCTFYTLLTSSFIREVL